MIAIPVPTETKPDFELPDWLKQCFNTSQTKEVRLICNAFEFAYQLHTGQYRKSGEPYIAHPVVVAGLLRDLGGDSAMIAAGFLHDVVEDTDVCIEEIEERFGEEVRQLVEGVTKLSKFNFSSKTERQAENFRRMFMAMAQDIRVIVVKLADRLHNMRTLEYLKPEKQCSIALETREIFAPLANRLGIGRFKWELEDLAFKYLEPEAYQEIKNLVSERRADREERIEKVITILSSRLAELELNVLEMKGRPKHLYGIYQKMQRQQKEFNQIYDIAALRIILDKNDQYQCYRALAVVHDTFRPIPGRFKDYIALPKPNRYQSLHTTVMSFNGRPLEMQIRTIEMHHVAEYGIAAHWKYKESGGMSNTKVSSDDEKFIWLRQLLEWQNDLKDGQEFIESLKENLFEDDVYVFTPSGDVVALKRGATPVDFAYHIHSEVGNHMKGARVNEQWSVLDRPLVNGDIVEIITSKNSHPSLDWLNFVVTPTARNRIRQWYKRSHREENVSRGRALLEKEVGKNGFDALLKSSPMQTVAQKCNYQNVEDLLAALGYGEITLNQVLNRLRDTVKAEQPMAETSLEAEVREQNSIRNQNTAKGNKAPIAGVEGIVHYIAGCCKPLPGEPIIGVVTNLRGISIHHQGCSNLDEVEGDRLIPVSWNSHNINERPPTYPVDIKIETIDRVGILKDILARLSDQHINVSNAGVKTAYGKPALISLSIDVCDLQQLDYIVDRIKNITDVLNIRRVK
ncbi:MAG: bifunctional (p)ppGpp synthetase/guanosine-3',5'-bis(diphosphate) 3'-pyrophosphohydrolase [Gomphosphaeria aponina SAG 52.96 = DSM 107014]|uniref:Bifunctional (P)ppGpp synthetase/guanosine-3',5'-bis(Diphosphate) 3'-pyrophosphohydrolase n=1 Tax=Gomphosphaeria aponina SAG 52.96 = DSM 107014 TaxID=1521640 RepID=A0A941JVH1_9CHRO|nr:bifunctional (p)ppGpp synthetase/guanosine-3',5'-bis(diphosphate) 3'-pyrophosphohydrolase [Gomphosphaeria aponina SAG 52.96 = DSM 107014]